MKLGSLRRSLVLCCLCAGILAGSLAWTQPPEGAGPRVTQFRFFKRVVGDQEGPGCQIARNVETRYWTRTDCGLVDITVVDPPEQTASVRFEIHGPDGSLVAGFEGVPASATNWRGRLWPGQDWPAGRLKVRALYEEALIGESDLFLNALTADVALSTSDLKPGDPVLASGRIYSLSQRLSDDELPPQRTGVPARFWLRALTAEGVELGTVGPFEAEPDGSFQDKALPAPLFAGLTATYEQDCLARFSVEVVDASWNDGSQSWAVDVSGRSGAAFAVPSDVPAISARYTSSRGWVRPNEPFPLRVVVRSCMSTVVKDASALLDEIDGARYLTAVAAEAGAASIQPDGRIQWSIGEIPPWTDGPPITRSLVVEARSETLGENPTLIWKDLATTATLTYDGGEMADATLGPHVIPNGSEFESARYGHRPFPMVPVDYRDRKHSRNHPGSLIPDVVNSKTREGSSSNLFREMSMGQLELAATVPSAAHGTGSWQTDWKSERFREKGFAFTQPAPNGACKGLTLPQQAQGTDLLPERIHDGWYQLPGDTEYYGGDTYVTDGYTGANDIDAACGSSGKAVYDAALIADPEIDYSDFDTDKDGWVDFFMLIYTGLGGNGSSHSSIPPYDNIWPHSSSLAYSYWDDELQQAGYISDDQLKDNLGRPLYYTDSSRARMTTSKTGFPVFVRVGPYNVNPESSLDQSAVIAHEYGHALGLPDFYSFGDRTTYGDWTLMASDKSQHFDVFAKQEMGWVIPKPLPKGRSEINGWRDSKMDTHSIEWMDQQGRPYSLQGPDVHNAQVYSAKTKRAPLIPEENLGGITGSHFWHSGTGNKASCDWNEMSRTLDIVVPDMQNVPRGTAVSVKFTSLWEIEWDFDHGYLLVSTDGGRTFNSLKSANGTTTDENPYNVECQKRIGNGITGSSDSYRRGTSVLDRQQYEFGEPVFVDDAFDLSSYAGENVILRFAYVTDEFFTETGWIIDDLQIEAGDRTLLKTDFENDSLNDLRLYPGGCRGSVQLAPVCGQGWIYRDNQATTDRGYYLEMRDRSGFDLDGKGQNDDSPINFDPGLLLIYTDETLGYGNTSGSNPPPQSPVDAVPQPGVARPDLSDASFRSEQGRQRYNDFGDGWLDNYSDPSAADGAWRHKFDCLSFEVLSMKGEGLGPATAPGDLQGDVAFEVGASCASAYYGQRIANGFPYPQIQAKSRDVKVGQKVLLSGSSSYDDLTPTSQLGFEWDLDNDGAFEKQGQTLATTFNTPGEKVVVLKVADGGGLSRTAQFRLAVNGDVAVIPLAATGPQELLPLFGLVLLLTAWASARWLRAAHVS